MHGSHAEIIPTNHQALVCLCDFACAIYSVIARDEAI